MMLDGTNNHFDTRNEGTKFENDLMESDEFEMKTTKDKNLHKMTYYNHLRLFNPSAAFFSLLQTTDNDKKREGTD